LSAESDIQGVGAIVLAGDPRGEAWAAARVRQAVRAAVDAGLWPVVVVIEPGNAFVRGALAGLPVVTCTGDGVAPGQGLRLGLARLAECAPSARGLVLLGCDGPSPGASHLAALAAAAHREGTPIAASARDGTPCVPALFAAALFGELEGSDDGDARTVLAADPARIARVELGRA
jgi:molybdenum cofactor cytidylyltransferase